MHGFYGVVMNGGKLLRVGTAEENHARVMSEVGRDLQLQATSNQTEYMLKPKSIDGI